VCRFFDAFEDSIDGEARRALVMEYIEGDSLTNWIAQRGPLSWPAFRRPALELLQAVNAMHRVGLRHRDIKPDNVRVETGSGRIVLVDFGVVFDAERAQADPCTDSHQFLGTIRWAPPEWVYRDPPDAAESPEIDVYGVGATFYYMITGTEPFAEIQNRAQLERAVREQPLRLRPSHFPRTVQSVLATSLYKKSDDRPTLNELMEPIALAPDDPQAAPVGAPPIRLSEIFDGDEARYAKARADAETMRQAAFGQAQSTILRRWEIGLMQTVLPQAAALVLCQTKPLAQFLIDSAETLSALASGDDVRFVKFVGAVPRSGTEVCGGVIAIGISGTLECAQIRRAFGIAYLVAGQLRIRLLKENPRSFEGALAQATADASDDVPASVDAFASAMVIANDLSAWRPPVLTVLDLSLDAARLAEHLVRISADGRSGSSSLAQEEVRKVLNIADDRINECVEELEGRGMLRRIAGVATGKLHFVLVTATEQLFNTCDRLIMNWSSNADAKTVARVVAEAGSILSMDVAKQLGWEPRRLNPTLAFLGRYQFIAHSESNDATYVHFQVMRNGKTRPFAEG
jgi:hypothetical protein